MIMNDYANYKPQLAAIKNKLPTAANKKAIATLISSLEGLQQNISTLIKSCSPNSLSAKSFTRVFNNFQQQLKQLAKPLASAQQSTATAVAIYGNGVAGTNLKSDNNPSLLTALIQLAEALSSFNKTTYAQMSHLSTEVGTAFSMNEALLTLTNNAQTICDTYAQEVQSNTSKTDAPTLTLNGIYGNLSQYKDIDTQGVLNNFVNNGIPINSSQANLLTELYKNANTNFQANIGNPPIIYNSTTKTYSFRPTSAQDWSNLAIAYQDGIKNAYNKIPPAYQASAKTAFPAGYAIYQGCSTAANPTTLGGIIITQASMAGICKQQQLLGTEITSAGQTYLSKSMSMLKDLSSMIVNAIDQALNIQSSNVNAALAGE